MKRNFPLIHTALTSLLLILLVVVGLPGSDVKASTQTPPAPTITPKAPLACDASRYVQVSGTAVVNVKPDRALIQLGVQSNGRSAKDAQSKNAATIGKVIKALKLLGIESKDISTDWYNVEPIYDDYDSISIKGYRIYNVIEITLRDVEKANDAIIAAFDAGANQVVNIDFYTSELRKYRDQAREMAMIAAKEKANSLAKASGAETGCILTITENTYSNFYGWSHWWGYGNNQNQWTQNAVQNINPASGETATLEDGPVSAGMISIRAEVNATFSLK